MTLNPGLAPYYRDYPMLIMWDRNKDLLFFPRDAVSDDGDECYDLTSKAYVLMKRLGQDYEHIMRMDSDERDRLFMMEMQVIKEERKQSKNNA